MQKNTLERRIPFAYREVFHGLLQVLEKRGIKTSACDLSLGRIQLDGGKTPRAVPTFQLLKTGEKSTLIRLEMPDSTGFDELMNDLVSHLSSKDGN